MIRSPLGVRICGAVLAAGLFLHCAHVEPPPGGPVDAIPPRVTAVFPAPGASNVPRDAQIILKYSEWIDRSVGRGNVFLSPPLPGRLKAKVEGDRLLINPSTAVGGLRPNTAYRLTVLGSLRDLHGVAMGRAFTITFTTGEGFDSGRVAGRAESPDQKGTVLAALYRISGRDTTTVLPRVAAEIQGYHPDSLPAPWRELPAFTTSTDSSGVFAFDSVNQGEYALLAYEDVNGNLAPDFGFEPVGVGSLDLKLTPRAQEQTLHLAPLDTAPARMIHLRFAADSAEGDSWIGGLWVKFSHPPRPDSALDLKAYRLIDSVGKTVSSFAGVGWDAVSSEAVLQVPPLRKEGRYRLEFQGESDTATPHRTEFSASATSDTSAWTLTFLNPTNASGYPQKVGPGNEILPAVEYPLQSSRVLTDARWRLLQARMEARKDTLPVKFTLTRSSPVNLTLKPESPLHFGQTLRLRLMPEHRDSSDTIIRMLASARVLDSLRLGALRFKVPGRVKGWTLLLQNLQTSFEQSLKPGASDSIALDPLPAGRYRLAGFLDRNNDGAWSPGRLSPWTPQEPYAVLLDSMDVAPGLMTDITTHLSEAGK